MNKLARLMRLSSIMLRSLYLSSVLLLIALVGVHGFKSEDFKVIFFSL